MGILGSYQKRFYTLKNLENDLKNKNVKMFALTIDGYYLKSEEEIYFIYFEEVCLNAKDYKDILVKQAEQYRSYEI